MDVVLQKCSALNLQLLGLHRKNRIKNALNKKNITPRVLSEKSKQIQTVETTASPQKHPEKPHIHITTFDSQIKQMPVFPYPSRRVGSVQKRQPFNFKQLRILKQKTKLKIIHQPVAKQEMPNPIFYQQDNQIIINLNNLGKAGYPPKNRVRIFRGESFCTSEQITEEQGFFSQIFSKK